MYTEYAPKAAKKIIEGERRTTTMASDASDTVLEDRALTLNPITLTKDTIETVVYHWKNKSINWPMSIYITLVHFAAVVGFCTIPDCTWQTCLLAFILWPIT